MQNRGQQLCAGVDTQTPTQFPAWQLVAPGELPGPGHSILLLNVNKQTSDPFTGLIHQVSRQFIAPRALLANAQESAVDALPIGAVLDQDKRIVLGLKLLG
jgi:hypothetical protein